MKKVTAQPKPFRAIEFTLNLFRREIDIQFPLSVPDSEHKEQSQLGMYRFRLPLAHLKRIYEFRNGDKKRVLTISMDTPPAFFRRVRDVESTHDDQCSTWNERQTWFRATEIAEQKEGVASTPARLRKDGAIIDIGEITSISPYGGPKG